MDIWNWIWANLTSIKDLLWIIFTLIATVIAILTYRRARFSLLQPLRGEVVKRQIDEMIELLEFLSTDDLDTKIDYMNILQGNFELKMSELGFKDKKSEERLEHYKSIFVGSYITKDTFDDNRYYAAGPFFNPNDIKEVKEKSDYDLLEEGIVKLHGISITEQHTKCMNEFQKYINSPIIPTELKNKLVTITNDISDNITNKIPFVIKGVILVFHKEKKESIQPMSILSLFSEVRIKHNEQIKELREEIREYLKIDLKW
ncbi:hypothetical protein [[Clostridium] innocuum]|uniref:hypothetical protein n=1 Tax=Clostridium innocuum TaxID=1522 RepID=UPI003259935C